MLGKIIKYDFLSMKKDLLPLYIVEICIALLYRLFNVIGEKVDIIKYVSFMILFLFVIIIISTFIYTFFISIKRYYNNMLKDEGYLTHTLPVKKWELLLSKVIVSFIFLVITIAITLVVLYIGFYEKGVFDVIQSAINDIKNTIGDEIIIYLPIALILGYMNYIIIVYFGLTLGFTQNSSKIGYSVLFIFVAYTISQIINSVMFIVLVLINPDLLNYINSIEMAKEYVNQVLSLALFTSITIPTAYCFVINYVLNKKLNLE